MVLKGHTIISELSNVSLCIVMELLQQTFHVWVNVVNYIFDRIYFLFILYFMLVPFDFKWLVFIDDV